MAAYGDFEIDRELFPGTPISRVYLANRFGGDARHQFVVKVFHSDQSADAEAGAALGEHLLKRARQQKKLASDPTLPIAPVLDFGVERADFWFAMPHFPKGSLKSVIVNGANELDLHRIILKIVTALIGMQEKAGRTHGNLKYSNIFFAGDLKSGPAVANADLIFTDVASAEECSGPDGEIADLRAIGVLINQIVHRSTADESEIVWPNAPSPEWDALGRKANYWRQLCDWLIQPNPSLAQLNLRQLSSDLQRKPQKKRKLLLNGGIAAAAVLVAAGVFAMFGPEPAIEPDEPDLTENSALVSGATTPEPARSTIESPVSETPAPAEALIASAAPITPPAESTQPATPIVEPTTPTVEEPPVRVEESAMIPQGNHEPARPRTQVVETTTPPPVIREPAPVDPKPEPTITFVRAQPTEEPVDSAEITTAATEPELEPSIVEPEATTPEPIEEKPVQVALAQPTPEPIVEPAVAAVVPEEPIETPPTEILNALGMRFVWIGDLPATEKIPTASPSDAAQILRGGSRNATGVFIDPAMPNASSTRASSNPVENPFRDPNAPKVNQLDWKGGFMGATEVMQEHYFKLMADNPSHHKGAQFPVTGISWEDAVGFCRRLTEFEKSSGTLPEGWIYTIPSEKQWDFVADLPADAERREWVYLEDTGLLRGEILSTDGKRREPVAAGSLSKPDKHGIHDLFGNVREWCFDAAGNSSLIKGWAYDSRGGFGDKRITKKPLGGSGNRTVGFRCILVPIE